jgi:hypothetical protein
VVHAGSDAGRRNGGRTLDWLDWLAGLTMSSGPGDLMSLMPSCASSSIWAWGQHGELLHGAAALGTSVWSVALVPLLSTGEGSTVAGYGLGGGTRWSEWAPEDDLFEKTWLKLAGELGESV